MKHHRFFLPFLLLALTVSTQAQMFYKDSDRTGVPFAKDPVVVSLNGRYLMYYSVPPYADKSKGTGWNIGIAESQDLENWKKIGEMIPETPYEEKGLCAPGALVRNDTIHLFYQTYGNGRLDAICHAFSTDGLHFERDATNPIFHPEPSDWTCGRAIDAEVTESISPHVTLPSRNRCWAWQPLPKEQTSDVKTGRSGLTAVSCALPFLGKESVSRELL